MKNKIKMFIFITIVLYGSTLIFFKKTNYHKPYSLVKPYPLVNSNVAKYATQNTDSNSITLLRFRDKDIYCPIKISQVALHYYKRYFETKDEESKNYFLKLAKWLLDNFTDNGEWGVVL
jgi:hypothetical protein